MRAFSSLALVFLLVGCGGGAEPCPPDYPVMRDGYCYRADGSTAMPDSGAQETDGGGTTTMDAGGRADSGTPPLDAGETTDGASVICRGTHPIVEGGRRYCEPGDCFCADPDACFPSEVAASCCSVGVVCGSPDGGTAICRGTHPIVEGTRRYCEAGDCFCATPDACFPSEIAATCCSVDVVCE